MITVYSTMTCPYCHALMEWLDEQGIEYEEKDGSHLPAVPVTEINGQQIIGFDRPAIKKALAESKAA